MAVDVHVSTFGEAIVIHSLSGGTPGELRKFFREVQEVAKEVPVFISVDIENPKLSKLLRVYSKCGAKAVCVLMEVSGG